MLWPRSPRPPFFWVRFRLLGLRHDASATGFFGGRQRPKTGHFWPYLRIVSAGKVRIPNPGPPALRPIYPALPNDRPRLILAERPLVSQEVTGLMPSGAGPGAASPTNPQPQNLSSHQWRRWRRAPHPRTPSVSPSPHHRYPGFRSTPGLRPPSRAAATPPLMHHGPHPTLSWAWVSRTPLVSTPPPNSPKRPAGTTTAAKDHATSPTSGEVSAT